MQVEAIRQNNIAYQGQNKDDDKKHVTTADVAAVTGTSAATATASRTGAWKTFKQFGFDTEKMRGISAETRDTIQFAKKTGQEAKGLWAGLSKNAKKFTDAIVEWGQNLKANKFIKPLFESPVFKKAAGAIGGATAFFVFVTGVCNMSKKVANGVQSRTDRFTKLAMAEDEAQAA